MDQIKIGRFIAERRKLKRLTQMQLADRLGITDRAVSKWENGKGIPDPSLMLDLCRELGISVNELLCGESIEMEDYNKKAEEQLLQMLKEKEKRDREMLNIEVFIGVLVTLVLLACVFAANYLDISELAKNLIVAAGCVPLIIGVAFALRIEQTAGYYECGNCRHRYVPTYRQVLFALKTGRTRYMKCPECGKKAWSRKVLRK